MSIKRIYVVSADINEWLVEATTAGQAVHHVTKNLYTARVANQSDLVRLIKAGKEVERANEEKPLASTPNLGL